jgi:hypothetical protein
LESLTRSLLSWKITNSKRGVSIHRVIPLCKG